MTTPDQTVWSIEPHTIAKHDLLKHYLKAWFPILARRERRIIFLDGFAGPGIYKDDEPGSPIIALKTLLNHSDFENHGQCKFLFLFIEKEQARLDRLKTELQRFYPLPSNIKVVTKLGEFQDVIAKMSKTLKDRHQNLRPTLAFVDPFGVSDVPMERIATFLASPKCELFLILMVDHLNRFLDVESMRSSLESLFGTKDFSKVKAAPKGERIPLLVELYEEQLRNVARFRYSQAFGMRRVNETIAYYVVYATRHITGVEKFKDAMWMVDPSTGKTFSDRNWNQQVLFTGKTWISARWSRVSAQNSRTKMLQSNSSRNTRC